MALIGWLWLASPFAVIGLISHDRELLAVVSAHHRRARAVGWTGVVITLLSVAVVPGWAGWMMYLVGLPLAGLVVWGLRDDGGRWRRVRARRTPDQLGRLRALVLGLRPAPGWPLAPSAGPLGALKSSGAI